MWCTRTEWAVGSGRGLWMLERRELLAQRRHLVRRGWTDRRPTAHVQSRKPRSGFVLLEAVIALLIISLFGVALLTTVGAQVRTADRGVVLLTSRALAEDRFMAIQMLDYEDLESLPDSLETGVFPAPFDAYSWTASTEPVGEEYDLFATTITVSAFGYAFPMKSMLHRPRPIVSESGQ